MGADYVGRPQNAPSSGELALGTDGCPGLRKLASFRLGASLLRSHLQHLRYLVWHKYYVLKFGIYRGVPLRQILVHDLSKFRPDEWRPYTAHFFPPKPKTSPTFAAFEAAFARHVSRNPHHWEHWLVPELRGPNGHPAYAAQMPTRYVYEMLADWDSTGVMRSGRVDTVEYYLKNRARIRLHPTTRHVVEYALGVSVAKPVQTLRLSL